jgi:hypothetical protein
MRIGFASIFSWRPHVEHLYFLATLARAAGHETHFLTCDADLPDCYARELRGRPAWLECLQCRSGGVRSFTGDNVAAIGGLARANGAAAPAVPREWAASSASTLGRFESDADYISAEFGALEERLYPAVQRSYAAARRWLAENALEALCVFNGRMDATRAVFEAARSLAIPVVSLERTWFGDGLQLYPGENCLGLRSVHALVGEWSARALTRAQALRAAAPIAARFLRTNVMEWRAYNTNAQAVPWPVTTPGRRILLLPSSRNEIWGHPDWRPAWPNPGAAYDALMAHLGLGPKELLLRCHPNWAEHIGKQDGRRIEAYYSEWARERDVRCIASGDPASTLALIEQCDAIVVAHGSAALEAGLIGKQVIATAPSPYQNAGFRDSACSAGDLAQLRLHAELDPAARAALRRSIARQTLRYAYTMAYRVPQYSRYVKADATTRFRYDFSADPQRFLDLLRGGALRADDEQFATDGVGEDSVLDLIAARDWQALRAPGAGPAQQTYVPLRRRLLMRPVDLVSRWKPVGGR